MCDKDILWQAYIQDIKTASHPLTLNVLAPYEAVVYDHS